MAVDKSLRDVLKLSSEMVRESTRLKDRMWGCLSTSAEQIEKSRRLLSSWPVNVRPALFQGQRLWETAHALPLPPEVSSPATPRPHPAESEASLERVEAQDFTETTVRLDGRHFIDCSIQNCVLEYWGGPVILESTKFSGCRFSFAGEAAMTMAVLDCFGMLEQKQAKALPSGDAGSKIRIN